MDEAETLNAEMTLALFKIDRDHYDKRELPQSNKTALDTAFSANKLALSQVTILAELETLMSSLNL